MKLSPTSVPGFLKDKKSNMIVPMNLDDKVKQVQANRQKFKEFQQMKQDIKDLQERIKKLEELNHH